MLIDGFGISGYRSYGEKMQRFSPLGKINLIVGKNNCGKSNILQLLVNYLEFYIHCVNIRYSESSVALHQIDEHINNNKTEFLFELAFNLNSEKARNKLKNTKENIQSLLKKIFDSPFLIENKGLLWITMGRPLDRRADIIIQQLEEIKSKVELSNDEWNKLSREFNGRSKDLDDNIKNAISMICLDYYKTPNIYLIPAIRFVKIEKENDRHVINGGGIIEQLRNLQNPDYHEQNLKKYFININNFLRYVLNNDNAVIEIPNKKNSHEHINVSMDGKTLPLESLGTGVHEIIILALAATLQNNSIICMEEPEIHLHPVLQKKLLKYLDENTTNQYFIATHSAHFLDYKNANVFHITHDGTASKVRHVDNNDGIFEICGDLGYRPSDLLQTNCIIWVEGPSDRIYINHWLKALDDSLVEGIYYSIMFYGGRLLSHLSADDKTINEFISLLCINRSPIIVIDSDRENESNDINGTKKRIEKEFCDNGRMVWITAGREIENYIDPDVYEDAVKKVHPKAEKLVSKDKYANLPRYIQKDTGKEKPADKIEVAKEIIKLKADLTVLDLKKRMDEILEFVRKANGMGEK